MGIVYAEITLKNAGDVANARRGIIKEPELRQMTVNAMVDTGAWTLVFNEDTRLKLGLEIEGKEPSTLADGVESVYPMTEPVRVHWKNRATVCQAIVLPQADDILLGALPMEAMDLTINPKTETVVGAHGEEALYKLK
jgi:clan AA aspartic protease